MDAADRPTLRPYQTDLVNRTRALVGAGLKRPLVCAATGSGKTLTMAEITRLATDKGKSVAILSPRRELVHQTSQTLSRLGVSHGVLMAGEPYNPMQAVQVICTPTLHARAVQRKKIQFPTADIVCIDEAHLSLAPTTQAIMDRFGDAVRIGFSATPSRGDGRGLGQAYDQIVFGPSVADLTAQGYLVPARYFTPPKFDVSGVAITKGDYATKQLGEKIDTQTLVGDVVSNWLRIAPTRKTIVFGVTQAHARHLQEAFLAAGIKAGYIDAETETDERSDTLKAFRSGALQVMCNCMVLSYGYDEPSASCIVLARPTKSLVMYFQSAGRGLRPFPEKENCIVIDHGGVVEELGFLDDPVAWTLDGNTNIGKGHATAVKERSDGVTCQQCEAMFRHSATCPNCGWTMPPRKGKPMATIDADLVELTKTQQRISRQWGNEQKAYFYGELKTYARQKGYSDGWIAHKYKTKTGTWPNFYKNSPAVEPSAETLSWLRAMNIRWAKSKNNPRAAVAS